MKTIGTKLDNEEFDEFLEICNEKGCSKSELLRKLVKDSLRKKAEVVKKEPKAQVTSWKLYDDYGRLVAKSD